MCWLVVMQLDSVVGAHEIPSPKEWLKTIGYKAECPNQSYVWNIFYVVVKFTILQMVLHYSSLSFFLLGRWCYELAVKTRAR